MDQISFVRLVRFLLLYCVFFCSTAIAGQWQPLYIDGIFLHHSPPQLDYRERHVFQLSAADLGDFGDRLGLVSDVNTKQVPGA
jgi:hypothetical protein